MENHATRILNENIRIVTEYLKAYTEEECPGSGVTVTYSDEKGSVLPRHQFHTTFDCSASHGTIAQDRIMDRLDAIFSKAIVIQDMTDDSDKRIGFFVADENPARLVNEIKQKDIQRLPVPKQRM